MQLGALGFCRSPFTAPLTILSLPRSGTLNVAVGFNPRQIEFIASLRDAESNFLAVPWVETHGYVQASLRDEYKKKGQDLQRSRPD